MLREIDRQEMKVGDRVYIKHKIYRGYGVVHDIPSPDNVQMMLEHESATLDKFSGYTDTPIGPFGSGEPTIFFRDSGSICGECLKEFVSEDQSDYLCPDCLTN